MPWPGWTSICAIPRGNVCVQMRGFSWRVLHGAAGRSAETLLAAPVWRRSAPGHGNDVYVAHHIVSCGLPAVEIGDSACLTVATNGTDAGRYTACALACFERLQSILRSQPQGRVLVQVAAADPLLAGLSGLLKSAALENPRIVGQLVLVPANIGAEALARLLREEQGSEFEGLIRYGEAGREVLGWEEIAAPQGVPVAFENGAVYLITGGLGALGTHFTKEILQRAAEASVVLTGRAPLDAAVQSRVDAFAGRVSYRQVDLADADQVKRLVAASCTTSTASTASSTAPARSKTRSS